VKNEHTYGQVHMYV